MAEHAPNTPATLARRRHVRAAPGAMDRRADPDLSGVGFAHKRQSSVCEQIIVTQAERRRIVGCVEMLIALLDALDAPAEDLEDGDPAEDDDPAECNGDPEPTPECRGEPTDDDMSGIRPSSRSLPPVVSERAGPGPFQLDSATYATVRGWRSGSTGRPA